MTRQKTGGRKANTPNKIPAAVKGVIHSIVSNELDNLPILLESLKPKDRADVIIKLISFVIPKQSKIELEAEIKDRFTPVVINIESQNLLE